MDLAQIVIDIEKVPNFKFEVTHIAINSSPSIKLTPKLLLEFPNLIQSDVPIYMNVDLDWSLLGLSNLASFIIYTKTFNSKNMLDLIDAYYDGSINGVRNKQGKENFDVHLRIFVNISPGNNAIFEYVNSSIYSYNSYLIDDFSNIFILLWNESLVSGIFLYKGLNLNLLQTLSDYAAEDKNLLYFTAIIDPSRDEDYNAIPLIFTFNEETVTNIYTEFKDNAELYKSSDKITQIITNLTPPNIPSSINVILSGTIDYSKLYKVLNAFSLTVLEGTKLDNNIYAHILNPIDYPEFDFQTTDMDKTIFNVFQSINFEREELPKKELNVTDILVVLKKGATLYHGSFYNFNKNELQLKYEGDVPLNINTYKGTWFSLSPNFALGYAIGKVFKKLKEKPRTYVDINAVDPHVSVYIVEQDIPMLLNFTDGLTTHTVDSYKLLNDLRSLNKIELTCNDETLDILSEEVSKDDFTNTNYFFAAILGSCVKGINGWIHLNDSHEVFLVEPDKWLKKTHTFKILNVTVDNKEYKFNTKEETIKSLNDVRNSKPNIDIYLTSDIIESVTFDTPFPGKIGDVSEEYVNEFIVEQS